MDTKEELAKALIVLMDLEKEDVKELVKLKLKTLTRVFEGQKKNALAYQHMSELQIKK